ncbi:Hypothetical protein POVR1_LOCUS572 [uncultured virus]|nr:Hypothetical protein POVR1_LOCUS572 [uncultured virus]
MYKLEDFPQHLQLQIRQRLNPAHLLTPITIEYDPLTVIRELMLEDRTRLSSDILVKIFRSDQKLHKISRAVSWEIRLLSRGSIAHHELKLPIQLTEVTNLTNEFCSAMTERTVSRSPKQIMPVLFRLSKRRIDVAHGPGKLPTKSFLDYTESPVSMDSPLNIETLTCGFLYVSMDEFEVDMLSEWVILERRL